MDECYLVHAMVRCQSAWPLQIGSKFRDHWSDCHPLKVLYSAVSRAQASWELCM